MDKIKIKKDNNMKAKDDEIGATLCDNCDEIVYESEFNLINDYDVVSNKCNEKIKKEEEQ